MSVHHARDWRCGLVALVLLTVLFSGCGPAPSPTANSLPTLGPDAVTFHGSTKNQNIFDPWFVAPCREESRQVFAPESEVYDAGEDPLLRVFAMIVDSRDDRYTGSLVNLMNYRNAKLSDYQSKTHLYWRETSYHNVGIQWTMPDRIVPMNGIYND